MTYSNSFFLQHALFVFRVDLALHNYIDTPQFLLRHTWNSNVDILLRCSALTHMALIVIQIKIPLCISALTHNYHIHCHSFLSTKCYRRLLLVVTPPSSWFARAEPRLLKKTIERLQRFMQL